VTAQCVTVRLPTALRRLADERRLVQLELEPSGALTVGQVLAALGSVYPGVHDAALDERGKVRSHVNVFVGADNIRLGQGLATTVPAGAEISILPAVSGG
jgi:molybdopterin converting factor small subunit